MSDGSRVELNAEPCSDSAVAWASTRPQVSVLMTVWNTAQYLSEAIDSVIAQRTDATWELIIVDDGSTDGSLSISLNFAARHPECITVLRHAGGRNRGISASRNLALRHARGEFIAFLDSDDVWLPHRLESQLQILQSHPEAAMVYANAERWCDYDLPFDRVTSERAWWGRNFLPPLLPPGHKQGLLQPGELLRMFMAEESMVPCICSVLVRADVARRVRGFEDQFRGLYDDQAFHAKVSLQAPVYASLDCVARYRQHGLSCCASGRLDERKQQEALARFRAWLADYRSRLGVRDEALIAAD